MGGDNTHKELQINHLNIFVCGKIIDLFINKVSSFQTSFRGHTRYTHPDTKWYFTEVIESEVSTLLIQAIDKLQDDEKNMVVILPVETLFCDTVYNMVKMINSLSTLYHPFLLLITPKEESKDDLTKKLIKEFDDYDISNVFVIRQLFDTDIREIYMRLFKICSYYNQLGDEFNFPLSIDLRNLLDAPNQDQEEEEEEEDDNEKDNGNIITSSSISDSHKKSIDQKVVLFDNNFTHRINFLVMGRPGAGKSAFINKLLGEKRCLEKAGKSVTSKILKYNHSKYPLGIYDTPGFETKEDMDKTFELMKRMNKKLNEEQQDVIHMVIYLINSQDERTLLNLEIEFLKKIKKWSEDELDKDISKEQRQRLQLIFVYTHGTTKKRSEKKKVILNATLKSVLNEDYTNYIFPVELFDDLEDDLPSFGMGRLMEYFNNHFQSNRIQEEDIANLKLLTNKDEAQIYSLVSHSRLLSKIRSKEEIKRFCRYCAGGIIASTTSVATAIGASPIPFADWFLITSIQVSMIIGIGYLYGFHYKKNQAMEILKSLTVQGLGSGICRGIASAFKCIPGIGTITGIVIDSLVSALGTTGIGLSTVAIFEHKFDEKGIKDFYLKAITEYNQAIDSFNEIKKRFNN